MKLSLPFLIIPILGCVSTVSAETQPTIALRPAGATSTYIPTALEAPIFTPPAPPVEKPIPTMRIDSAITVPSGKSHTLTILRGEPSDLPDIPEPVVAPQRAPRQFTAEDLARQAEQRRLRLNFSAQVYENGVSILRWTHPDTAEPYQATCGFDVNLLAGIGQFISHGKTYQLSFVPPGVRPAARHRLSKRSIPPPPEAAPGTVTFTKGNPSDPIGTATAVLLRDLIAAEQSRLITYQENRAAYFKAAAEWHEAHPVPPRDETIWFRPHRGSRYLTNPTPEKGTAQ